MKDGGVHVQLMCLMFLGYIFQPKSQSWNKKNKEKETLQNLSMWTRNYRPKSKIGEKSNQQTILSHMTSSSTKGKECTVAVKSKLKLLPKKSPSKRAREGSLNSIGHLIYRIISNFVSDHLNAYEKYRYPVYEKNNNIL